MAKKGKDSKEGHNRLGGINGEELKVFIERIEALEDEKRGIGTDIKDVFATAKAKGFDPKTMRKCIALRKQTPAEREHRQNLQDTYMHALGMLPLFENADEGGQASEGVGPP